MPSFIDIATLTKRATITGQEEFQVSATEKVTSEQLAKFAQMLTGFSTLNTTDGVINGESNLLGALQVLYKLSSGNGKIRMLNGGTTFGFAYCDAYMSGFIVEVENGQVYWIMDDGSFNGDYSTATDYGIINVIRNNGNCAQLGCITISNWKDVHNNFYTSATPINKKTNIVPVISTSNLSSGPQTTAPYVGFALIISSTVPYKVAYFVADGNGDFHYAFVKQTNIDSPAEDITWNKVSAGDNIPATMINDFADPPSIIMNATDGKIIPITVDTSAVNVPAEVTSGQKCYGYAQLGTANSGQKMVYYVLSFTAGTDNSNVIYLGFYYSADGSVVWSKITPNTNQQVGISTSALGPYNFNSIKFMQDDGESYGSGSVYTITSFLYEYNIQLYGQLCVKRSGTSYYEVHPFNVILDTKIATIDQNITICEGILTTSPLTTYFVTLTTNTGGSGDELYFEFNVNSSDNVAYLEILGVNFID